MAQLSRFLLFFFSLLPAIAIAGNEANFAAPINQAIVGLCPQICIPVDASGLGNFPWVYQNNNQVFNDSTLAFISARVMPGSMNDTVKLSAAGGFINAYVQVISKLTYALSSRDQVRVKAILAKAESAATTTVTTYENIFGSITADEMSKARQACGNEAIQSSLDYIITYIMGSIWSGRGEKGLPPLTITTMTYADNLSQLLPLMPPQGSPVVATASEYLQQSQEASTILSGVEAGSWEINKLNQNTGFPTGSNGGMLTVNPQTGAVSTNYQPGYTITRSIADIYHDLNDPSRTFQATVYYPDASGMQQKYVLKFSGYTYIPISPSGWQETTGNGWYAGQPIAEAQANETKDVTGYKFVINPDYNMNGLAKGGNFGRLTGLLVCASVQITSASESISATTNLFAPTWLSTLFGGQSAGFSSPPPLQQQAYVIAATVDFPAEPVLRQQGEF